MSETSPGKSSPTLPKELTGFLILLSLFKQNRVGLSDHVAVCVRVCVSPTLSLRGNGSVKVPLSLLGNGSVKFPLSVLGNGTVEPLPR
jgi:hypothetical protein